MILNTYKLNRQRKQIQIKEIDTDKFERIGTTGSGYALKYNKGKTIYLFGEWYFDNMLEEQRRNNEAVEHKCFSYARINENESSSKQNTKRDEKGRKQMKVGQGWIYPEDLEIGEKNESD